MSDTSRTALVTGANRGLGQSTAVALAAAGHRVIATCRKEHQAEETLRLIEASGGDAFAIELDLSDVTSHGRVAEQVQQTLQTRWDVNTLDVLVNNAGVGIFDPLADVTPERFDAMTNTNFRGTFFLLQALVPLIAEGGAIVNVSTSLTRHVSTGTSVYAATKTAVESLTRSLACELGSRGIRVNSIAPGPTATDFNGGAMRDDDDVRKTLSAATALGRVGQPDDISAAIVALVSGQMQWATAERLEVSGGAFL